MLEFHAELSSLNSGKIGSDASAQLTVGIMRQPVSLTGYSPVSSMQAVAAQHQAAISGSMGSAVVVAELVRNQLDWASRNLGRLEDALRAHEALLAEAFAKFDFLTDAPTIAQINKIDASAPVPVAFIDRPVFAPGPLTFTPAVLGAEASMGLEELLALFDATDDAAVGDAVAFWTQYATMMSDIASQVLTVTGDLISSNTGDVFIAADATLTSMAMTADRIASTAGVMAGHLQVLPAVKSMAVNHLSIIAGQSQFIDNPVEKEAFERAAITSFMTGSYLPQLQHAVPKVVSLADPAGVGGVSSVVDVATAPKGATVAGSFELSGSPITGGVQPSSSVSATSSSVGSSPQAMTAGSNASSAAPGVSGGSGASGVSPTRMNSAPTTATGAAGVPTNSGGGFNSAPAGISGGGIPGTGAPSNGGVNAAGFNTVGGNHATQSGGQGASGGHAGSASRGVRNVNGGPGSGAGTGSGAGGFSGGVGGRVGGGFGGFVGGVPGGVGNGLQGGLPNGSGSSSQTGSTNNTSAARGGSGAMGAGGVGGAGAAGGILNQGANNTGGSAKAQKARVPRASVAVRTRRVNGLVSAEDYEQYQYQLELFGERPKTVNPIIGGLGRRKKKKI